MLAVVINVGVELISSQVNPGAIVLNRENVHKFIMTSAEFSKHLSAEEHTNACQLVDVLLIFLFLAFSKHSFSGANAPKMGCIEERLK